MLRRDDVVCVFAGGHVGLSRRAVDPGDYPAGVDPAGPTTTAVFDASAACGREGDRRGGRASRSTPMRWCGSRTGRPQPPRPGNSRRGSSRRRAEGTVAIDDREIRRTSGPRAADAIERHRTGDVSLLPPTWVTLAEIQRSDSVGELLDRLSARTRSGTPARSRRTATASPSRCGRATRATSPAIPTPRTAAPPLDARRRLGARDRPRSEPWHQRGSGRPDDRRPRALAGRRSSPSVLASPFAPAADALPRHPLAR